MFKFRYLFLVILSLYSNIAFSSHYTWANKMSPSVFSSPSAACQAIDIGLPFKTVEQDSQSSFHCVYDGYCNYGSPCYNGKAYRSGDSCPPNTEYNPQTGECLTPEPEPESFEFLFCYIYDGGQDCAPGTNQGRPNSFCKNGIQYSADYNPSTTDAVCVAYRNGDGTSGPAVMCRVTGTPTKQSCNTDYKTDTPDNSCPAGTVGGVFNNKRVCVPSGTGGGGGDGGKDGDNSGDGGGDGDGSGGETGGGGDGNGSDGDGGGTGSGGNSGGGGDGGGGSSGGGDGNGDGDGTGDGSGNGTGDGEGEGGGGGKGDSVEGCEDGECSYNSSIEELLIEVPSYQESTEEFIENISKAPVFAKIKSIKFPTGGTCPKISGKIEILFGVINIDTDSHCELFAKIQPLLSAVFIALWSLVGVRVFLTA